MSIPKPAIATNTTSDPVITWRTRRLIAAGVRRELAEKIAVDGAYDLHAMLDLIDRGCPPELALRILAPLDGPAAALQSGRNSSSSKGEGQ